MVYPYNGYYSVFKEILTYATTWMNLEDTMLKTIRQSQKEKYAKDSNYMRYLEYSDLKTKCITVVSRGWGKIRRGSWCSMSTEIQFGKMKRSSSIGW